MTIPNPIANFKNWFIFLLLIACTMLWFKTCHPSTPSPAITQNNKVNYSIAPILEQAKINGQRVMDLTADTIVLNQQLKHARDSLKRDAVIIHNGNTLATALANDIADAHIALDTLKFYKSCDSLAKVTQANQSKFAMYERDSKNTLAKCDALSLKKSQTIVALTSEANGYKSAYTLEKMENTTLVKMLTPHNKVYIGLEAWSCPAASGVGPGIMYQMKDEKIVGLSGGIATTGGWWVGGKAYIKIQLHK